MGKLRRGWRAAALAAAVSLLLPACWYEVSGGSGNKRFDPLESQLTAGNATALAVDWRVPVAGSVTEPVVSGNLLFVARSEFDQSTDLLGTFAITAYDRTTGAVAWERSLLPGGEEVGGGASPLSFIDGALWVRYWHDRMPSCTGRLLRLDPATGAVLSDDQTSGDTGPVLHGGSVVAYEDGCGDGRLVVKDVKTRTTLWTSAPLPAGYAIGDPTIAGGHVVMEAGFVRDDGRSLLGYALGGCGAAVCAPDWSVDDPAGRATFDRPVAGPGGLVYTTANQLGTGGPVWRVEARSAATGALRWRSAGRYSPNLPEGAPGIAVTNDTLYVTGTLDDRAVPFDEAGTFDAYPAAGCGAADCAPAWSVGLGLAVFVNGAPIAAGGVVWIGTVSDGASVAPAVLGIDAAGCGAPVCTPLERLPLAESNGGAFATRSGPYQMALDGGQLFVASFPGSEGSELLALSA